MYYEKKNVTVQGIINCIEEDDLSDKEAQKYNDKEFNNKKDSKNELQYNSINYSEKNNLIILMKILRRFIR